MERHTPDDLAETSTFSTNDSRGKNHLPTQLDDSNDDNQNASYHPSNDGNEGAPLEKSPSMLQRMQTRLHFFDPKLKGERKYLTMKFIFIYGLMGTLILAIFAIYWGSLYKRDKRFGNLRMLVVIEDNHEVDGVPPAIGDIVRETLQTDDARSLGGWIEWDINKFNDLAQAHNNTIFEEVQRQIHHQRYWAAVYVKPNSSVDFRSAILSGDVSNPILNTSITCYYETGRDFAAMSEYVLPNLQQVGDMVAVRLNEIVRRLFEKDDYSSVFSNANSVQVATTPATFDYHDAVPVTDLVTSAPAQVGLIYMIIITFFSLNFFMEVHQQVAKMGIKFRHMMLYRIMSSIFTFFIISLFYSLVTLAFQVDFTRAFGKSGFLVYWMTNFLTMWAVGAMNETVGMLFIMLYPPLVGFWLVFWVISNIAPTFAPIALCAKFFRYGYAMPIHASYEVTKVIFFDTYKGAMGRNYGILVAWDAFATLCLIFSFKYFAQVMGKRAAQQKAQIEADYEKRKSEATP